VPFGSIGAPSRRRDACLSLLPARRSRIGRHALRCALRVLLLLRQLAVPLMLNSTGFANAGWCAS